MNTESEAERHLEDLHEIRVMMERSSRFISLSGLSGVFAGIIALAGACVARWYMNSGAAIPLNGSFWNDSYFLFADAAVVLTLSIGAGIFFTTRNAKRKGQKTWDMASQHLVTNLAIPLITGGIFCLILFRIAPQLIAPSTMIFYGLALLNASKYTLPDIRYLGLLEILLGLVSCLYTESALLFWAIGFGLLHIIYGAAMYYKYER